MGNAKSKNNLSTLLKKWEESETAQNDYKSFSCKVKDVTIHKLNGEFYVENSYATIGPMTKDQLIMLSQKSPKFQLGSALCKQPTPDGDTIEGQSSTENGQAKSTKTDSIISERFVRNVKKLSTVIGNDTHKIKMFKNEKRHQKKVFNERNDLACLNHENFTCELTTYDKCNSLDIESNSKSNSRSLSKKKENPKERKENNDKMETNDYKSKVKFSLQSFQQELALRNQSQIKKIFAKPETSSVNPERNYQKQERYSRNICEKNNDMKNVFPRRQPVKTIPKELNLSYKKKKIMKRQFHQTLIENFKESLLINNVLKDKELGAGDQGSNDVLAKGGQPTDLNSIYKPLIRSVGFSEPINDEKFRYTAFAKADNINWAKQKSLIRRLKLGFEKKFGCTVHLGDEIVEYRGDIIYTVNIEGKDKISVLKCRNCLPYELKTNLILSKNIDEESKMVFNEKWKVHAPYHPDSINRNGSKAVKLSF